jgi:hypothetical protein
MEVVFIAFCVMCFTGIMTAVAVNKGWIQRSDVGDI